MPAPDWVSQRFRKVHLDFHTPPWVKVGEAFDPDQFGDTLVDAGINALVVFAKDHYGLSYYDTKIGARHPGLDFDLMRAQIDACRARDIKVMAYLSVVWENLACETHPDWRMISAPDHQPAKSGEWKCACLNSPYVDQSLFPQVREVLENYPIDGLWFDIVMFPGPLCYCPWCREYLSNVPSDFVEAAREIGDEVAPGALLDPADPEAHHRFNSWSTLRFLKRTAKLVREIRPEVAIAHNAQTRIGTRVTAPYMDLFEIESLPHGWGYLYYPAYSRYERNLDRPMGGITGRFFKSWGDFGSLKSRDGLVYECASMLATGGMCSIGDQMNPDGKLVAPVYKRIGEVYRFVKVREEWCRDAKPVVEIGVLADEEPGAPGNGRQPDGVWGAVKALMEEHFQFDLLDSRSDLAPYRCVVLPDNPRLSAATAKRLAGYVEAGGSLLASAGAVSRAEELGLARVLGVKACGESEFSLDYLRLGDPRVSTDLPEMDLALYDRSLALEALPAAQVLAELVHPLRQRGPESFYSHAHAPSDEKPFGPGIIAHRYGFGQAIAVAAPLFSAYMNHGNPLYRTVIRNLLLRLLNDQQLVRIGALPSVEASLMRQGDRMILHLVQYHAERRGKGHDVIEHIPPITGVKARVLVPRKPGRVYEAPLGKDLSWSHEPPCVQFNLPELRVHAMVVIE